MLAQLDFQIVVDPGTENLTNLMKLLWFFSRQILTTSVMSKVLNWEHFLHKVNEVYNIVLLVVNRHIKQNRYSKISIRYQLFAMSLLFIISGQILTIYLISKLLKVGILIFVTHFTLDLTADRKNI